MSSFAIYMNIFWLPVIMLVAGFIGFMVRNAQFKNAKQKIASLENEMLRNHAEILSLQKEIVKLKGGIRDSKTPVVNIKATPAEETKTNIKEGK